MKNILSMIVTVIAVVAIAILLMDYREAKMEQAMYRNSIEYTIRDKVEETRTKGETAVKNLRELIDQGLHE